jgi:nitroimidazol reductase NimA-like FMN-containing flavoprotein (pyridoxamine 5'-phosphate oxidase superfamily)
MPVVRRMQLVKKLEIQSKSNIVDFLNRQPVGRVCSIDASGFPQIIPMNFVYSDGAIYMHSHPFGEKLDNIRRNRKVGFEVDQHVCFLPSYYFHPTDASQADTLYVSVVIKGTAEIVEDAREKARALNALMEKYQKEGKYEALDPEMPVVEEVAIIKVVPKEMRGKYKIGQHWARAYRLKMAEKIIEREGPRSAASILEIMGIDIQDGKPVISKDPVL